MQNSVCEKHYTRNKNQNKIDLQFFLNIWSDNIWHYLSLKGKYMQEAHYITNIGFSFLLYMYK